MYLSLLIVFFFTLAFQITYRTPGIEPEKKFIEKYSLSFTQYEMLVEEEKRIKKELKEQWEKGKTERTIWSTGISFLIQHSFHFIFPGLGFLIKPLLFQAPEQYKHPKLTDQMRKDYSIFKNKSTEDTKLDEDFSVFGFGFLLLFLFAIFNYVLYYPILSFLGVSIKGLGKVSDVSLPVILYNSSPIRIIYDLLF